MDFDPSEWFAEGVDVYDEYESDAEIRILEVVSEHRVVTDRELKVRLERDFFPWVVGRALNTLTKEGKIRLVQPPGRKGRMGTPRNFFMDPSLNYDDVLKLMLKKRRVTSYINSLLTRLSPAGFHAEDVFERAFNSLRFKILGRDVSEFGGKSVKGVPGKEPPNLDFVIEKNSLIYGVDVKNWIKYEFDSIFDIGDKVELARQLKIIPFIFARYVDKDTLFKIVEVPGIVYRYKTLILPPEFDNLAHEAETILGYPILATETLPAYKLDFIRKLHVGLWKRLKKRKG